MIKKKYTITESFPILSQYQKDMLRANGWDVDKNKFSKEFFNKIDAVKEFERIIGAKMSDGYGEFFIYGELILTIK